MNEHSAGFQFVSHSYFDLNPYLMDNMSQMVIDEERERRREIEEEGDRGRERGR